MRSAAQLLALSLALPVAAAEPPPSGKYWVFLGTYTGPNSQGIYRCELDVNTGKLSDPELAAKMTNPSFLAFSPNGKALYAVGEVSGQGPRKNEGSVAAFAVDPATGNLTALNDAGTGGPGPCHVSMDPTGKFLIVANYSGGSVAVLSTKPDGSLAERTAFVQHTGSSVNPTRQKEPHAHCGFFDETGRLALVCDLGLDKVMLYRLDPAAGTIAPNDPPFVALPPGSGPRHLHLAPGGRTVYVNGELDSTVHVVELDREQGRHSIAQSLSTLPVGTPVTGNSTAEIRLHPSGKFVYVSNRGHNSIAAFRADPHTGKLAAVGHATSPDIKIPRNFNVDPTGRWMLVASQDGDNVAVFAIDPDSGLPVPTGDRVSVGKPVCVKFLPKP